MRIFFANIGNRNLNWNKELTKEIRGFRNETNYLLANFDLFKEEIDVQIIPPLLVKFGPYDKIILVATDGSHEQDTIHAAEMVKRLLIKNYHDLKENQIQIQRLTFSIIEDEKVLNFYKGAFYQLLKTFEAQFELHICDAGGTPQQKLAMKIMADFIVPEEQLKILYIDQQNESTLVNLTGYRNIIQGQAVIRLIQTGSYRAALVLRNREEVLIGKGGKNKADKLIRLGYYLINNQWPLKLKNEYKGNYFPKDPNLDKLIESLFAEIPCLSLNPFEGMNNQWFLCSQNYYLSRFYLEQNEFNKAILCFANFYEKFYNDLARKFIG